MIIIISLLVYVALDRLLRLQVEAEKAAVEQVLGSLNSALALQIAEHIAQDRIPQLKKFIATNPMDLLASTPPAYLDITATTDIQQLPAASWYFDSQEKVLVYKVQNRRYLFAENGDSTYLKFKLLPVFDDNNRNRRFDKPDTLKGLFIHSLTKYRWLKQPAAQIQRGIEK